MSVAPARRERLASAELLSVAARADFLSEQFGVTALAGMLGVSKGQPSQWRRGNESPSVESARKLIDLDHVYARALLLWKEPVARRWLMSGNGFLDGARPIDVLALRGPSEVLDALDATMEGAFA